MYRKQAAYGNGGTENLLGEQWWQINYLIKKCGMYKRFWTLYIWTKSIRSMRVTGTGMKMHRSEG